MKGGTSKPWQSIIWGREVLKLGIRWRIGNGESVQIMKDPWLPTPTSFKIISPRNDQLEHTQVVEIIKDNREWDWEHLRTQFLDVDLQNI